MRTRVLIYGIILTGGVVYCMTVVKWLSIAISIDIGTELKNERCTTRANQNILNQPESWFRQVKDFLSQNGFQNIADLL